MRKHLATVAGKNCGAEPGFRWAVICLDRLGWIHTHTRARAHRLIEEDVFVYLH